MHLSIFGALEVIPANQRHINLEWRGCLCTCVLKADKNLKKENKVSFLWKTIKYRSYGNNIFSQVLLHSLFVILTLQYIKLIFVSMYKFCSIWHILTNDYCSRSSMPLQHLLFLMSHCIVCTQMKTLCRWMDKCHGQHHDVKTTHPSDELAWSATYTVTEVRWLEKHLTRTPNT